MTADDGKQRLTDAATAETLLRLVQSVPSPKAEPVKLWLAKVGYERMQESRNGMKRRCDACFFGEKACFPSISGKNLFSCQDSFYRGFGAWGEALRPSASSGHALRDSFTP